jgi:integrase
MFVNKRFLGEIMKNKKKESELHTLSEAIEKYEKEVLYYRTRNTQKSFFLHLDFWDKNLGNQTLAKLENSALIIKNLRDSLQSKERSNTTLNRYLSALSAVLGRCVKDFLWMDKNPCSKIMKKEEPTNRIRYLSKQEQEYLLDACEGDLWDAVVMALKTGARKQEIWRLKFEDIDFKRNHIRLMETKSGKPRSIPMTQDLMEILQRRRVDINFTSHYVFPSPVNSNAPNNFERAWDTALKNSGIENFRWHDLRHTFASRAIMAGVTLRSLADLLGHSKVDMVFRYAHLSPQHLASSMELAGEEIGECKARVKKSA